MQVELQSDFLEYLGSIPGPYQRGNKNAGIRELTLNAYEADASKIKITFKGFSRGCKVQKEASIIIEDDGWGITPEMLQDWFKYKVTAKIRNAGKKRKIIGGGGKGRVGTFLLGNRGRVTSRRKGEATYILEYDFTNSQATLTQERNDNGSHGTKIEVFDLHGQWSKFKILSLCDKLVRLYRRVNMVEGDDCEVSLWQDKVQRFAITYRLRSKNKIWSIIIYRLFILNLKKLTAFAF